MSQCTKVNDLSSITLVDYLGNVLYFAPVFSFYLSVRSGYCVYRTFIPVCTEPVKPIHWASAWYF